MSLNVAFPELKEIQGYDPARIAWITEYIMLEHLFSPLLSQEGRGEIKPLLASDYGWKEGAIAYIKLRKDLKTSQGEKIKATDVICSLKRLLLLKSNTHGRLQNVLSPNIGDFKNLDDQHSSLYTNPENDTVYLKLKKKYFFIFDMLTTIDFVVIPRSSIDPKTLAITNYRNSTGPYSFRSQSLNELALEANKNSPLYSANMPQEVVFIGSPTRESSRELVMSGKADFITTIDKALPTKMLELHEQTEGSTIHYTKPLLLRYLKFTKKGLEKFSLQERRHISLAMHEEYIGKFTPPLEEATYQYFPRFAEGSLDEQVLNSIISEYKSNNVRPKQKMRVAIFPEYLETYKNYFGSIPWIEFMAVSSYGEPTAFDSIDFDAYFLSVDSGYHEDISLISFAVGQGILCLRGKESEDFLAKFTDEEDKAVRIQMVQKIHKMTLEEVMLVPFGLRSFIAYSKSGLKINFPKYYVNTQLWNLSR